jgi:DNA-binding transcriptional ArsR family regulator
MSSTAAEGPAQPPTSKAAEALPHPSVDELDLAAVLHALSDPMRLRIVHILAEGGEHNCKSIGLPVTKSTATHHFRVLREAGILQQRLLGTTRLNVLRRDDLEARFPGLLDAVLRATVITD